MWGIVRERGMWAKQLVAGLLVVGCSTISSGSLAALEIPIDGFIGDYALVPRVEVSQTASLSYEPPDEITSLYLRLVGTAVPGVEVCGDAERLAGVEFLVWITGPQSGTNYMAFDIYTWDSEVIDISSEVTAFPMPAELEQVILSGNFELKLSANFPVTWCAFVPPYAEVSIDAAYLLVNVDPSVEDKKSTWGAVKATFR